MPKDYKPRPKAQKKRKEPASKWVWFGSGLLSGSLLVGLAWFLIGTPQGKKISIPNPLTAMQQSRAAEEPKPQAPKKEEKPPEVPKPRFDFYTILPEMEVVVSEPEEENALAAPAAADAPEKPAASSTQGQTPPPAPVQSGGLYMLQMGSFRAYGDAERLKARLALLGVVAEIQVVDVTGGGTFHRVRSGPMTGTEANRLRARLQKESINCLVMKLKK